MDDHLVPTMNYELMADDLHELILDQELKSSTFGSLHGG